MTPTTRHALALPCALALMACSGADDPALPAVSTVPVTETLAPTTLPPPTTTAATAPLATSSTSVTPATTAAEPPDTAISVEDEVIAAYLEAYEAFWAASQDPANPILRRALERSLAGEVLRRSVEVLDRYVLSGRRVVPNRDVPAFVEIRDVRVEGGSATVVHCSVNSWVLIEDSSTASGVAVVDESVVVTLAKSSLELRDGRWIETDGVEIGDLSEVGGCAS